ncbi:MAG: right-handed parallel beta-helix repeat-containing protein [Candidatus Thorarchaeota archaeon]|jgi:parallel beta-helix repeat protein
MERRYSIKKASEGLAIIIVLMMLGAGSLIMANTTADVVISNPVNILVSSQGAFTPHENILIQSNEDLLALASADGLPGNGTEENPIIISGYNFYNDTIVPVQVYYTDLHWIFRNNLIETDGEMSGIFLTQTTWGVVVNNTFRDCYSGVSMLSCDNIIIEYNMFTDNAGNGVDQEAALNNSTIRYNTFLNHDADAISLEDTNDLAIYGNFIRGATFDGIDGQNAHDVFIENNTILDTTMGIRLGRRSTDIHVEGNLIRNITDYGITCNADTCHIQNNVLRDVGKNGIIFSGSFELYAEDNVVTSNTFINCEGFAVNIDAGCTGISITSNDFFETQANCHICDNSTGATISDNFYDTWTTPDVDEDGIVDTPYTIGGSAGSSDLTPQSAPTGLLPDDYEYTPYTPTTTENSLPLLEMALIGGIGLIVCVVVVVFVKKR